MRPLPRAHTIAAVLWMVLGIIVWNGVYDLIVGQGIKEYLFRQALYRAGAGPAPSIGSVMDTWVFYATWVSTVWASVITLAGLFTVKYLGGPNREPANREPANQEPANREPVNREPVNREPVNL